MVFGPQVFWSSLKVGDTVRMWQRCSHEIRIELKL